MELPFAGKTDQSPNGRASHVDALFFQWNVPGQLLTWVHWVIKAAAPHGELDVKTMASGRGRLLTANVFNRKGHRMRPTWAQAKWAPLPIHHRQGMAGCKDMYPRLTWTLREIMKLKR